MIMVSLPLLLAAAPGFAAQAPEKIRIPAKTTAQAQAATQEVERFLDEYTRASSLEDLAKRFRAHEFTPAELQALKRRLQDPRFEQKLDALVRQEKRQFSVRVERPSAAQRLKKPLPRTAAAKAAPSVQARLPQLRAEATRLRRAIAPVRTPGIRQAPSRAMLGRHFGPEPSNARITSLSPPTGRLGEQLVITGQNLGTARGRVAVSVGAPDRALGNMSMAEISSWSPTRIVATLPADLQPFVGESPKEGLVWVKLAGGETGPYSDYRLEPDLSQLQPGITGVTPEPLRPGSDLVIAGENFLTEAPPTVTLSAASPDSYRIEKDVLEWGPNYVVAGGGGGTIPYDAEGTVRVTVRNHLGLEASRWVAIERPMQRRTFSKFHNHRVQCELWSGYEDRPSVFCLAGYKKTFAPDWGRCPGWSIIDYSVRIVDEGGSNGYVFRREPFGQSMSYEIEVWADLYSWLELEVLLEMEGPQGTSCW
jgi:hypothetical protein